MTTTTVYAKVIESTDKSPLHLYEWRPWINMDQKNPEMNQRLILHRWIRNRGGIQPGERLSVTVYTFSEDVARHPDGNPVACLASNYEPTKES